LLLAKPEATEAEIIKRPSKRSCTTFTSRCAGYDTLIGEQGLRLSGGERQRWRLRARAEGCADPHFDEATANPTRAPSVKCCA